MWLAVAVAAAVAVSCIFGLVKHGDPHTVQAYQLVRAQLSLLAAHSSVLFRQARAQLPLLAAHSNVLFRGVLDYLSALYRAVVFFLAADKEPEGLRVQQQGLSAAAGDSASPQADGILPFVATQRISGQAFEQERLRFTHHELQKLRGSVRFLHHQQERGLQEHAWNWQVLCLCCILL
jgi:hypothetical protein